jgi:cytochrome c oxidase subunit 2
MRHTQRGVMIIVSLALILLFVAPAAAQPSVNTKLISGLNEKLLYAAVPITVLVEGILIYTVYRFKDSGEAKPTQENRRLEITWTVATAIILLFVGLASYQVLTSAFIGGATVTNPGDGSVQGLSYNYSGEQAPTEENAVQVEVVARQFSFTFNYIKADGDVTSTGTLVIPANRPVYLHVTSVDVIHSFHAPVLGLKQDAIPGQYNTIKTKIYEPGTYQLYCAEYCGVGHSNMLGTIKVMPPEEYQHWLEKQEQASSGTGESASRSGNATSTNASVRMSRSRALITPD